MNTSLLRQFQFLRPILGGLSSFATTSSADLLMRLLSTLKSVGSLD